MVLFEIPLIFLVLTGSLVYTFRSYLLGLLDYLIIPGSKLAKVQFIQQGFGDLESLERLRRRYKSGNGAGSGSSSVDNNDDSAKNSQDFNLDRLKVLSIGEYVHESSHTRVNVTFESPVADCLPECSRKGYMQVVLPPGCKTIADAKSMPAVILSSATGEEGYGFRRKVHGIPLAERNIVSVIPMFPFYAARRPDYQKKFYTATASDMGRSVPAGSMEIVAIASWLCGNQKTTKSTTDDDDDDNDDDDNGHNDFDGLGDEDRIIIFTGRSMGACTAGIASLMSERRHGLVTLAPPLSAAAGFVDGVLTNTIDWNKYTPKEQEKLKGLLESFNVAEAARDDDDDDCTMTEKDVRCIIAKHDKFVILDSAKDYVQIMKKSGPNVRVAETFVPGGHIAALSMHSLFVKTICDSIASFKKHQ